MKPVRFRSMKIEVTGSWLSLDLLRQVRDYFFNVRVSMQVTWKSNKHNEAENRTKPGTNRLSMVKA
jgi:hypothetical protein